MPRIKSWDGVSTALDRMGELQRKERKIQDEYNAEIAKLINKVESKTKKLSEERFTLETEIESFALAHEGDFEDAKTRKFPAGKVSLRIASRLQIPNTKKTIELLKKAKRTDAVEIKEVISKTILKKLPDDELKRFAVTRITETSASVTLNKI